MTVTALGRFEAGDPFDRRLAHGATGLLRDFNVAGVLEAADVHVAGRLRTITDEDDELAVLALALACRAVRQGSVCVDLALVGTLDPAGTTLPWPAVDGWVERVAASRLASSSVLRVEGGLVYLDRYWREEGQVRDDLVARSDQPAPGVDAAALRVAADRIFREGYDEQREVALRAAGQWTTVLIGGPGTGKTTTVAGLLAMLVEQATTPPRIALTAPTGKAAARLQESVRQADALTSAGAAHVAGLTAQTVHRLLGWRPDSRTRFRHDRGNRLPHDVVVVDETSMVSLTMMARLLEAVRPDARLVLVGDPDQLASVEAGAVLADLVAGLARQDPGAVAGLVTPHRFGRRIGDLAQALRDGDDEAVLDLLRAGHDEILLVDPDDATALAGVRDDVVRHALAVREAAASGDADGALAAMDAHRMLCAHREGPYGVATWNRTVERGLADVTGAPVGAGWGQEWYVGRPLLVTSNDYGLELFNGDTGVVVRDGDGVRAVIGGTGVPGGYRTFATSRLSDIETLHAMTVHKSQGSQAGEVTVLLPPEDSPLLTRELFYTAVTRAQRVVRVVGTEAAIRAGVRRRAQRATGLADRLGGA